MSDPFNNQPFPRGALLAAGALLGFVLLAVAGVRLMDDGTEAVSGIAPVEQVTLRFEDRPDGALAVYAADDGDLVTALEPGTNGFVRGVLRGLARDRKLQGVGTQPPFQLTLWPDGRLSLADPSTGRVIDLNVFGETNLAAFAALLRLASAESGNKTAALRARDGMETHGAAGDSR